MPLGTCPKCGAIYHGWALLNKKNKENQKCDKCGAQLVIIEYDPKQKTPEESVEVVKK